MKNAIFWFITFALIAIVIGVTVIFTPDFGHEKNENKIWVVSTLTLCNDPWDRSIEKTLPDTTDKIIPYYDNHDIEIHDLKTTLVPNYRPIGDTCSWPTGHTLFLLIDESNVKRMLTSGFIIAEGNNTEQTIDNNYRPESLD